MFGPPLRDSIDETADVSSRAKLGLPVLMTLFLVAGCGEHSAAKPATAGHPTDTASGKTAQDIACGKVLQRVAPGMTYGVSPTLDNAYMTAADAQRSLASTGDRTSAAYWGQQPPAEAVYVCSFTASASTSYASTGPCPTGQIPQVGGPGALRTFLVDGSGHTTEYKAEQAEDPASCAPTG
jgi:hypothetical protein